MLRVWPWEMERRAKALGARENHLKEEVGELRRIEGKWTV